MANRSRRLPIHPLLLSILSLALVAVGCGGGGGSGGGEGDEAGALLKRSFAKQIDSGDLTLSFEADLEGSEMFASPISGSISGPVAEAGGDELPQLDWDVTFEGQGQKISAGIVVTEDNAFLDFRGQQYEVGTAAFQQFAESFEEQAAAGPQSLEAYGVEADQWLEDPTVEDGEEIGGDPTRVVTGSVDTARVVEDIVDATQSQAYRKQLEAQGQSAPDEPSEEEIDQIEEAIDDIGLRASIDEQDVLRGLELEVDFTVPEDVETDGTKGGTVTFDYKLETVGGPSEIEEPADAADAAPLSELLQQFGLGGLSSGGGSS